MHFYSSPHSPLNSIFKPSGTNTGIDRSHSIDSPKFGWTFDKQPDYEVTLYKKDFVGRNPDNLMPSDAFVEKVAKKVTGKKLTDARFVVIPNVKAVLRTRKRVEVFQENLMQKIADWCVVNAPEALKVKSPEEGSRAYPLKNTQYSIDNQKLDFYEYHNEDLQGFADGFAHFDYYNFPILSFHYQAFENMLDGTPRIVDVRQFAKDYNMPMKDVQDVVMEDESFGKVFSALHTYFSTFNNFDKYSIPIDPSTEPLVIINNVCDVGVMHGRSTAYPKDRNKPVRRVINHSDVLVWKKECLPNADRWKPVKQ